MRKTMVNKRQILNFLENKPENCVYLNDSELAFVIGFFPRNFGLAALEVSMRRHPDGVKHLNKEKTS